MFSSSSMLASKPLNRVMTTAGVHRPRRDAEHLEFGRQQFRMLPRLGSMYALIPFTNAPTMAAPCG